MDGVVAALIGIFGLMLLEGVGVVFITGKMFERVNNNREDIRENRKMAKEEHAATRTVITEHGKQLSRIEGLLNGGIKQYGDD